MFHVCEDADQRFFKLSIEILQSGGLQCIAKPGQDGQQRLQSAFCGVTGSLVGGRSRLIIVSEHDLLPSFARCCGGGDVAEVGSVAIGDIGQFVSAGSGINQIISDGRIEEFSW
jgi:hypothetical protein